MTNPVAVHYCEGGDLAQAIAARLQSAGKDLDALTTADLATVDEFHIRGRKATLELAERMSLRPESEVLDIGSGLGGAARALAETYGCHVTGVDLTPAFCQAAEALSGWLGLSERVAFEQADATALPFADDRFDAAMTIHAAMNIAAKPALYEEARRVVKPAGIFAVYDVLQGEGGEVLFPVPWAREPSISHLATPERDAQAARRRRLRDPRRARLDRGEPGVVRPDDRAHRAIGPAPRLLQRLPRRRLPRDGPQPAPQRDRTADQDGDLHLPGVRAADRTARRRPAAAAIPALTSGVRSRRAARQTSPDSNLHSAQQRGVPAAQRGCIPFCCRQLKIV